MELENQSGRSDWSDSCLLLSWKFHKWPFSPRADKQEGLDPDPAGF